MRQTQFTGLFQLLIKISADQNKLFNRLQTCVQAFLSYKGMTENRENQENMAHFNKLNFGRSDSNMPASITIIQTYIPLIEGINTFYGH